MTSSPVHFRTSDSVTFSLPRWAVMTVGVWRDMLDIGTTVDSGQSPSLSSPARTSHPFPDATGAEGDAEVHISETEDELRLFLELLRSDRALEHSEFDVGGKAWLDLANVSDKYDYGKGRLAVESKIWKYLATREGHALLAFKLATRINHRELINRTVLRLSVVSSVDFDDDWSPRVTAWRTECLILFHRLAFSSPFNGASAHCDSSGGCDLGTVLQTWHAYLRFAAMDETLSEKPLSKVFLPLLKSETSRICAKHRGKVVAAAEELEREFVEARPPLVPPPVTDAEE